MAADAARSALVITASDGANAGVREDTSGARVAARLEALGFTVERRVLPDEQWEIEEALVAGASGHALVVTTGGTGLTPRDVTPQATRAVVDYEVPGLAEAMRAVGRAATPLADLSRAVVGVRGRCLIVNLPGSPKGALESLEAVVPVLDHALETLAGPFDHDAEGREPTLQEILAGIAQQFDVGSAAVVIPRPRPDEYEIAASIGLDAAAADGLVQAMKRPGHPIARTFADPVATYDVTPINPGGPALRSHLPLVVRRDGADHVVGVLALAYDQPIEADLRPILEAETSRAAVALDSDGAT